MLDGKINRSKFGDLGIKEGDNIRMYLREVAKEGVNWI